MTVILKRFVGRFSIRISSVNVTKSAALLKKSLMENFIFCAVNDLGQLKYYENGFVFSLKYCF